MDYMDADAMHIEDYPEDHCDLKVLMSFGIPIVESRLLATPHP